MYLYIAAIVPLHHDEQHYSQAMQIRKCMYLHCWMYIQHSIIDFIYVVHGFSKSVENLTFPNLWKQMPLFCRRESPRLPREAARKDTFLSAGMTLPQFVEQFSEQLPLRIKVLNGYFGDSARETSTYFYSKGLIYTYVAYSFIIDLKLNVTELTLKPILRWAGLLHSIIMLESPGFWPKTMNYSQAL